MSIWLIFWNYLFTPVFGHYHILGKRCSFDHRTLSYKRQKMACENTTTVMIHLLKEALDAGASAVCGRVRTTRQGCEGDVALVDTVRKAAGFPKE
jgi:hypothetical protein